MRRRDDRGWPESAADVVSLGRQTEVPWALPIDRLARSLDADLDRGLGHGAAAARLETHGPNQLRKLKPQSIWRVAGNQLASIVIWLLISAAVVSAVLGDALEAGAIGAAVVLTFLMGFITELRAVRSMEALRKLETQHARVKRDGLVRDVDASTLVPGDVVVFESGDRISADLRVVEAAQLQADESILSGESVPVGKASTTMAPDTALADRRNMLFKGTSVARGSGVGLVVGTGMDTELGRIATLVEDADSDETPLEKQLAGLARTLLWVCLGIAAITAAVGAAGGRGLGLMLTTAIALAVAAIPEGLPIVATIALARGMWRLAARHALIKKLSAVETLGATNLILVDKTGTLTENKLSAVAFAVDSTVVASEEAPAALFEIANLCNNASLSEDGASGDPLEIALLRASAAVGRMHLEDQRRWPRVREVAFDPKTKMMATVHRDGAGYRVAVKGAAETVAARCTSVWTGEGRAPLSEERRATLRALEDELARDGLRVLAFAHKGCEKADEEVYRDLALIGLIGFADPPRRDVATPLAACRSAGIRVVMATGDQPVTAASIAVAVGLTDDPTVVTGHELDELTAERRAEIDVFARVAPEQKLELVEQYQRDGGVVAMTGDGVNDAPALRKADIGVAMGKRGTDVAREAADMVLVDDSFESIVVAVEQGRAIFENIRRFVIYLLSCNLSEVLVVSGAIIVGAPLPLLPLQILFLNLVTDVFPALALGFGKGAPDAMERPPRDRNEPIVGRRHWKRIAFFALLITGATLGALAMAMALGFSAAQAGTVSFLTLGFAQLWHVFNLRSAASTVMKNDVVGNPWVWAATALCVALLVLAGAFAPLARVLSVQAIGLTGWIIVLAMSFVPVLLAQLDLAISGGDRRRD